MELWCRQHASSLSLHSIAGCISIVCETQPCPWSVNVVMLARHRSDHVCAVAGTGTGSPLARLRGPSAEVDPAAAAAPIERLLRGCQGPVTLPSQRPHPSRHLQTRRCPCGLLSSGDEVHGSVLATTDSVTDEMHRELPVTGHDALSDPLACTGFQRWHAPVAEARLCAGAGLLLAGGDDAPAAAAPGARASKRSSRGGRAGDEVLLRTGGAVCEACAAVLIEAAGLIGPICTPIDCTRYHVLRPLTMPHCHRVVLMWIRVKHSGPCSGLLRTYDRAGSRRGSGLGS